MGEKVLLLILIMLVTATIGGMFVSMNSKIDSLEYELNCQRIINAKELEEVKKNQRITAQDVDVLEKIVKEDW